ncbi:acyltransferase family protein [Novosphingobium sp.]|uniref:acyltransferase family protein n=1 Tax=Novosphingobium sp. TaxID=1874826 RepID=UPI00286EA50A|nr:acyltransferase family protein [Novosphingobium sp.]
MAKPSRMDGERFIDRPTSIMLDLVRFLSALGVMLVHAAETLHYTGALPFTPRLSHNSVIMFFVLSGLMIDHSARSKAAGLGQFAVARTARILPVAVPAMAFTCIVYTLAIMSKGPLPDGFGWSLGRSALAGLTFTSQSDLWGTWILGNGPWWSLSYEVWYYVLFAAAFFLRGWKRVVAVPLLALVAGSAVLLLLPAWLAGVWLNRDARLHRMGSQTALAVLLGCLLAQKFIATWDLDALMWLREASPFSLGMSEWLLSDLPLALVFVALLAALRPLAQAHAERLEAWQRPIRFGAGFSFTLYLFHMPLLDVMKLAGVSAGSSVLVLLGGIATVLTACAAIAQVTEGSAPHVRRWLEARFAGRARGPQALAGIA